MNKRLSVMLVLLLANSAALLPTTGSYASMQETGVPGKWPGGRITWYYNPAGRPANVGDAEVIAAVTTAFGEWQRVCQIEAVYAGNTSVPAANPLPATTYVVGWTDLAGIGAIAAAGHQTAFTGGEIQISNGSPNLRSALDSGDFLSIVQHEIAHSFGLAHSDDPASIMYSNPINSKTYQRTLQGDDIAACADLYGGRGLINKPDLRNAVPEPGFAVQLSVLAAPPGSAIPAGSLTQVDPVGGGPYYFAFEYQRLRAGANLEVRWVTPNGTVDRSITTTTATGTAFQYATLPDNINSNRLQFAGRWAFQLLVDGHLAASVPFEVVRGSVAPVPPFEAAMIGEADANGILAWRIAAYGNGGVRRASSVDTNQTAAGTVRPAPPGENVTEIWAETNRPRYRVDQADGQPAHSFDVMRQVRFAADANGLPVAALRVNETGTPDAYSAIATVAASGTGPQGVYVAAVLGGRLYYRQTGGWSESPTPLVTLQAPAVASVDLVRNFDTRGLPAGTLLYVGYGRSLDDLLARGQYALVRQF